MSLTQTWAELEESISSIKLSEKSIALTDLKKILEGHRITANMKINSKETKMLCNDILDAIERMAGRIAE